MKYRILLLAALMCAIPVAAMGGTLSAYTSETALSVSMEPQTSVTAHASTKEVPPSALSGDFARAEEQPLSEETPENAQDVHEPAQEQTAQETEFAASIGQSDTILPDM